MRTVKLYDENSHLFEFSAVVTECEKCDKGYKITLDKTAFFPEGGGQSSDRGTIDNVSVFDVKIKDGIIYHYADTFIAAGKTVNCSLDKNRRFYFMQNHSGEHIVSGIVNKLYGFENVGFHLGDDFVTLDFNGILDRNQLDEIEYIANEKIWQNVKFKAYYPTKEELSKLEYRSKKELEGDIRIVEIENTDICACCAPHVNSACEIGVIKLLDTQKMRGGTRIFMKCGNFALNDYRQKYESIYGISCLLSAKQNETLSAVEALDLKCDNLSAENAALKSELVDFIVKETDSNDKAVFCDMLDIKQLQALADGLHKTYGGIRAAFAKKQDVYAFAICGEEPELSVFFDELKRTLNIRGGGRDGIRQGSIAETKESILKGFKE